MNLLILKLFVFICILASFLLVSGCINEKEFKKESSNYADYLPGQKPVGMISRLDEVYSSGQFSFTVIIYELDSPENVNLWNTQLNSMFSKNGNPPSQELINGFYITKGESSGLNAYSWISDKKIITVGETNVSGFKSSDQSKEKLKKLVELKMKEYPITG